MGSLADLKTAILENCDRPDLPTLEITAVVRWINQAVRTVCEKYNFESMERQYSINTIAGVDHYAYPSPLTKDIKRVDFGTTNAGPYVELEEVIEDQWATESESQTTSGTGEPRRWCRFAKSIVLHPRPSVSTFSLRATVWNYPADLVMDDSTNDIVDNHGDYLETVATGRAFMLYGQLEMAQAFFARADQVLKEKLEADSVRLAPNDLSVTPGEIAGVAASARRGMGMNRTWPLGMGNG